MRKYPALAKNLSKEKLPHRFINNIRQKRAYEQEPYIYPGFPISIHNEAS